LNPNFGISPARKFKESEVMLDGRIAPQ
jgi:hypothetical protein